MPDAQRSYTEEEQLALDRLRGFDEHLYGRAVGAAEIEFAETFHGYREPSAELLTFEVTSGIDAEFVGGMGDESILVCGIARDVVCRSVGAVGPIDAAVAIMEYCQAYAKSEWVHRPVAASARIAELEAEVERLQSDVERLARIHNGIGAREARIGDLIREEMVGLRMEFIAAKRGPNDGGGSDG